MSVPYFMKKRRKYAGCLLLVLILAAGLLAGCGSGTAGDTASQRPDSMQLYFLNLDGTTIIGKGYTPAAEDRDKRITECLEQLKREDFSSDSVPPVRNYSVTGFTVIKHRLTLNITEGFRELDVITQTLSRAAIISTLCQISGVESVGFFVNGTELADSRGQAYGYMTPDQFAKGSGTNIQDYEKAAIRLYFANEAGTMLVPVTRTDFYNTNVSMEQYVVEQLIQGPRGEGSYASLPGTSKLTGVTSRDGICYVSFDASFLSENFTASPEVVIYSIVNTLTELNGISKVQISIGDPPELLFKDTIALGMPLERNLDLIEGYTAPEASETQTPAESRKGH